MKAIHTVITMRDFQTLLDWILPLKKKRSLKKIRWKNLIIRAQFHPILHQLMVEFTDFLLVSFTQQCLTHQHKKLEKQQGTIRLTSCCGFRLDGWLWNGKISTPCWFCPLSSFTNLSFLHSLAVQSFVHIHLNLYQHSYGVFCRIAQKPWNF